MTVLAAALSVASLLGLVVGTAVASYHIGYHSANIKVIRGVFDPWLTRMKARVGTERASVEIEIYQAAWSDYERNCPSTTKLEDVLFDFEIKKPIVRVKA